MNSKFKLVVASGKGGVGKSMLTSALAMLSSKRGKIVAIDADVDTPNLAIWLNEIGRWLKVKKISLTSKPVIDRNKCINCGKCVEHCQFNAMSLVKGKPQLNKFTCEGCGACQVVCPVKAITMKPVITGEIKNKLTKYGFPLIIGQLYPGETGSGKMVQEIKQLAEKFTYRLMIIDSAPGIGCPVIATLQDANFALLITEPTPSGLSDLNRVLKLVEYFHISFGVVINKWDINPRFSQSLINKFGRQILGKISYDQQIFKTITRLVPIMETNLPAVGEIKQIYQRVIKIIN